MLGNKSIRVLLVILVPIVIGAAALPGGESKGVARMLAYFKTESAVFAATSDSLLWTVHQLDATPAAMARAKEALLHCRLQYKRIEFFLQYFFPGAALVYNGPAKYEVEEPDMEFEAPIGLQQVEALLFQKEAWLHKEELLQQAKVLRESAHDIPALLYRFTASDAQVLESQRLELVRVIALGISGYDAPLLKSGIQESQVALEAMQYVLQPYVRDQLPGDSVTGHLFNALSLLRQNVAFDDFDRLQFLTAAALPLQQALACLTHELRLDLNTVPALDPAAKNLFAPDAINKYVFPATVDHPSAALVQLGQRLFHTTTLSGNGKRSCATCHQPDRFFTDGLPKSVSIEGGTVSRNAPTLLYASYQYRQFWDGRAASLSQQVRMVMTSKLEMDADTTVVVRLLQKDTALASLHGAAFARKPDWSMDQLAQALAAYLQTLAPFNSAFDQYLQGNHQAMTPAQQKGFNLFMGKAQCGTCHFAPLFNGLLPPAYNLTEFEVLGTPATAALDKPIADTDGGRYNVFPSPYYQQAFKTPTVRNSAVTGPYMHHGMFASLDEVVKFYNRGGGAGIGLSVPVQTLSPDTLGLTAREKRDLVAFLEALTDQ